MHCQDQLKVPTTIQKQNTTETKPTSAKKPLVRKVRQKKTGCPSTLKLTVTLPSEKSNIAAAKKPYHVTHPTILHVSFNHNHPLHSSHVLAFRPIATETKQKLFDLFWKGHATASAHHWHETKLYLDGEEDQISVADRVVNPTRQNVNTLHTKWQREELGNKMESHSLTIMKLKSTHTMTPLDTLMAVQSSNSLRGHG